MRGRASRFPVEPGLAIEQLRILGGAGNGIRSGVDNACARNEIFGDHLCGPEGGRDTIFGSPGHGILAGEQGDDWINGADGYAVIYGNSLNSENVESDSDRDHLSGDRGNDRIYGDSFGLKGGGMAEVILGMAGNDAIMAGPGVDEVTGDGWSWAGLRAPTSSAARQALIGSTVARYATWSSSTGQTIARANRRRKTPTLSSSGPSPARSVERACADSDPHPAGGSNPSNVRAPIHSGAGLRVATPNVPPPQGGCQPTVPGDRQIRLRISNRKLALSTTKPMH